MSTQKRETRNCLATLRSRTAGGTRRRRPIRKDGARARRRYVPAWNATGFPAVAPGITASFLSMLSWIRTWLATNFLHEAQPFRHSIQRNFHAEFPGAAPPRRHSHTAVRGTPGCPRSSLSPMSFLPGFAPSPVPLPYAPAARYVEHRAERYDGKRDLYFLHAA